MPENENTLSEADEQIEQPQPIVRKRRGPLARVGCAVALILWFTLLLSPCFAIVLVSRGEISIPTGNAPEQRIRVWLIMEAAQRGLGISNASIQSVGVNQLCVQTNISFLLWQGRGEPSSYCECYERNSESEGWNSTAVNTGACVAPK
jgi:hypothetical protein